MELPDIQALFDYWAGTPPLRDLVSMIAQLLGWDGSRPAPVEGEGTPATLSVPGEFEE